MSFLRHILWEARVEVLLGLFLEWKSGKMIKMKMVEDKASLKRGHVLLSSHGFSSKVSRPS